MIINQTATNGHAWTFFAFRAFEVSLNQCVDKYSIQKGFLVLQNSINVSIRLFVSTTKSCVWMIYTIFRMASVYLLPLHMSFGYREHIAASLCNKSLNIMSPRSSIKMMFYCWGVVFFTLRMFHILIKIQCKHMTSLANQIVTFQTASFVFRCLPFVWLCAEKEWNAFARENDDNRVKEKRTNEFQAVTLFAGMNKWLHCTVT